MAAFRFRLQRLVPVRAIQEQAARASWLEVEHSARDAEQQLGELRQRTERAQRALGDGMRRGAPSPSVLVWQHAALDRMARGVARWRERARSLRFQADRARAPWQERRRDLRALEHLRRRQHQRHDREEFKREIATLDEVACNRSARDERAPWVAAAHRRLTTNEAERL